MTVDVPFRFAAARVGLSFVLCPYLLRALSIETIITFFAASIAIGVAPGPDNIFVLTQSALRGPKAGLLVTLGLCTGLIGHTLAVALGLAALLKASALAFTVLKLIGAGYLLYLAWRAFADSSDELPEESVELRDRDIRLYRRGIVMNITNPKVSLFFLAYLPQFVDPDQGSVGLQIGILGALFMLMTLIVFGGIALLAGQLGRILRESPRIRVVMNRIAGVVFVTLALKLLLSQAS